MATFQTLQDPFNQPSSSGGWSPRRESGHTNNPRPLDEAVSGVRARRVRVLDCLSLAFNLCCLPGNFLPVLSGASP
jgi:hypothetical protein